MCWKLLLSLFVGYNDNTNIRPHILHTIGKNIDLDNISIHKKHSYYDNGIYFGYDTRYNNLYDKKSEMEYYKKTEQMLNISRYYEIAKHIKTLEFSYASNFDFIQNDDDVRIILNDFFDYNSIQPMRITNGLNNDMLYDW